MLWHVSQINERFVSPHHPPSAKTKVFSTKRGLLFFWNPPVTQHFFSVHFSFVVGRTWKHLSLFCECAHAIENLQHIDRRDGFQNTVLTFCNFPCLYNHILPNEPLCWPNNLLIYESGEVCSPYCLDAMSCITSIRLILIFRRVDEFIICLLLRSGRTVQQGLVGQGLAPWWPLVG